MVFVDAIIFPFEDDCNSAVHVCRNWSHKLDFIFFLCKEGFFELSNPDVLSSRVNQNRLYIVYPFKFGIV